MKSNVVKKARPYWHVDTKWIFGILAVFAVGAALLLFNLMNLTKRDFAVEATATVIADLFSREGLDATSDGLEELRSIARESSEEIVTPIEEFPSIQISAEDLLTLAPKELRIKLFSQLTETVYDEGLEGAADEFTDNPEDRRQFISQASLLGIFTHETHQKIRTLFWISTILALLFLAGVVGFSAGWGRAVSPGFLLLMVSWPGALTGLLASNPPGGDSPFASLPTNLAEGIGRSLNQSYLVMAITGVVLLLIALTGKIVQQVKTKRT